jgi:hypothetical protein
VHQLVGFSLTCKNEARLEKLAREKLANIRIGFKGLKRTNTLAYFYGQKKLITAFPDLDVLMVPIHPKEMRRLDLSITRDFGSIS